MHEMKKTKEVAVNFSLKWEYMVLEEVVEWLVEQWGYDDEIFKDITETNQEILEKLVNGNNKSRELRLKSEDKDLVGLFDMTLKNLIDVDPILARIFIHNSTVTQDIHIRKWLRDNYISDEAIDIAKMPFDRDWLVDSELAKRIKLLDGKTVKGIPLRCFFVGETLNGLLHDFEHYKFIDLVKMKGADGSIAELRESRIYESDEGVVYDYSPLFKKTYPGNESMITDYFMMNEHEQTGKKGSFIADDILSSYAQKTQLDSRKGKGYRSGPDIPEFIYTVRDGTKEKMVPFQFLPKWDGIIRRKAEWIAGHGFVGTSLILPKANSRQAKDRWVQP